VPEHVDLMGDILFLAHRVPFPPNRGDKIRAHHLLGKLAQLGLVHVGCFAENDEDRAGAEDLERVAASHCIVNRTKPLVLAGIEAVLAGKPVSLTAFHSPRLENWIAAAIAENAIETIVIFSGQMGQYIPAGFAGRVVIDLCDVDSAKFESYAAAGERVWLNMREARLLGVEEERLSRRADATILISDAEADLFRSRLTFPSKASVQVIGNGIDAALFNPAQVTAHDALDTASGPHLVFTGQMDYRPNEQAALWAIEQFLPELRPSYPNAQLHIVGRNPTARLMAQNSRPGVRIWGEVPDIRPFIAGATCVIAPLLIARGVQNKVLEAMAMARPVLLTPQAATGIAAQNGRDWMVEAADPTAIAARLDALIKDPDEALRIGKAAREFVLANHVWDAMLAPLEALIAAPIVNPCREDRHAA
jgi:sugar transferase (PEP-CTERM/EpsH1 system associated)